MQRETVNMKQMRGRRSYLNGRKSYHQWALLKGIKVFCFQIFCLMSIVDNLRAQTTLSGDHVVTGSMNVNGVVSASGLGLGTTSPEYDLDIVAPYPRPTNARLRGDSEGDYYTWVGETPTQKALFGVSGNTASESHLGPSVTYVIGLTDNGLILGAGNPTGNISFRAGGWSADEERMSLTPEGKLTLTGILDVKGPVIFERQGDILMGEFGNPE